MSDQVILVPLDGSKQALAAVPVAKVLGEVGQVGLHILYVGEKKENGAEQREQLSHGTQVLDGLGVHTRVGAPNEEIVKAARELDPLLVVVCRNSRSESAKLLGRTATTVLREVSCPVVLVPPERGVASWQLQHMLVPHDGTPTTSAALKPAMELASRADAALLVAHVSHAKRVAPSEPGTFTTPFYADQAHHEWPAWRDEFAERIRSICPLGHLHVRVFLAHGDPASEILRLSEQQSTDLIVLAWRGKWESPRAAILKDVLQRANCPVMVVRARC